MNARGYFDSLSQCFIIAELGVNHNGDLHQAHDLIDEAVKAGADAVKFQTFTADSLALKETPKVKYQISSIDNGESHKEMLSKLELDFESHKILKDYCEKKNIIFMSTPYDIRSAQFLNQINLPIYKTSSADLVDLPLHRYIAKTGKPCIISSGMASLGEIERTVSIYSQEKNTQIALLHCVSNYPCSDASLNLRVMKTLKQAFQCPIGFSDHSIGCTASVLSIGLGARVIEKHLTLNKKMIGPDHSASSNPEEFSLLVKSIRRAESMMGSNVKKCQPEELDMLLVSRKSIVLNQAVRKNQTITPSMLTLKRPGNGLGSEYLDQIIGRKLKEDLGENTQLNFDNVY